jgi:hypothetical protein
MNIYSFIPLIAAVAYLPLLVTTLGARPWRPQHRLFTLFLLASILWSSTEYVFRSNFFPLFNQNPLFNQWLFKVVVLLFVWTTLQFHCLLLHSFPRVRGAGYLWPISIGIERSYGCPRLSAKTYLPSMGPASQYSIAILNVIIPLDTFDT